jgi:cobalamin biosynthesis protein CobD/CbiB
MPDRLVRHPVPMSLRTISPSLPWPSWWRRHGYPQGIYRGIGHPVTWMGALIAWLDRSLNCERWTPGMRRAAGLAALAILLALTGGAAVALAAMSGSVFGAFGTVVLAVMATSLIAQRSLAQHVARVAAAMGHGIEHGRVAVAQIVGRDPAALDEPAICRAAIESLAENFPTASSRRRSGWGSAGSRAGRSTRRSTPRTA